jgi:hypothetical protein
VRTGSAVRLFQPVVSGTQGGGAVFLLVISYWLLVIRGGEGASASIRGGSVNGYSLLVIRVVRGPFVFIPGGSTNGYSRYFWRVG